MKSIQFKDNSLEAVTHYKLYGHRHDYARNFSGPKVHGNGNRDQAGGLKRRKSDNPCFYTKAELTPIRI
jgi:hypothetical protein